jgi:hypothetical protein
MEDLNDLSDTLMITSHTEQQRQRTDATFIYNSHDMLSFPFMEEDDKGFYIRHQCKGPAYDTFTTQMYNFATNRIITGAEPLTWGDPDYAQIKPNSTIVFIGNSHTRQLALAWLGQRYNDIIEMKSVPPTPNFPKANTERKFVLRNNITVYIICNSAIVHSPHWVQLLTNIVNDDTSGTGTTTTLTDQDQPSQPQRPLNEMVDAMVLGIFNSCKLDKGTNYEKDMQVLSEEGISCATTEGPTVKDVAAVYTGPLLFTTMFSQHRAEQVQQGIKQVQQIQQGRQSTTMRIPRTNIDYIDSRTYVDLMGIECAHANGGEFTDCVEGQDAYTLHRCVGAHGGHPDMVAWSVTEWFRQHL